MAGYDDYQTEEEYIAASKRRVTMADTKERAPSAWQRRPQYELPQAAWEQCHAEEAAGHFERRPGYEYRPLYSADAIERLERERDEAREAAAFHEHNWQQERDLKLGIAAELTTLRTRVEGLEEALRWELNILDVEVRPVVKPSKKEWIARRIERLRAALTEEQP